MNTNTFELHYTDFFQGMSPLAHLDERTFRGNAGQASDMMADVVTSPGFIKQGPGLSAMTNGTQSGVVSDLIRFILDQPVDASTTYAVGESKLYKLTPTEVVSGGSPSWPQTIAGMTEGESIIRLTTDLLVFYNTASGGDIARMPLSSGVIDPDWGSTTDQTLESAPHPAAVKEDLVVFGNGRYLGVLTAGSPGTLDVRKVDFGEGSIVSDVLFTSNNWYISVNSGEGRRAQVYLYEPSAQSNTLQDELGLGTQQIGFLYVHNGNIFVAYEDKSADGYIIGWLAGRSIKPLRYFSGSLPTHRQKTLYQNTILFPSSSLLYSCGAIVDSLPLQISPIRSAGYDQVGAVAAPFGTPMIASTNGSGSYQIARFSGLSLESFWKGITSDTFSGRFRGMIDYVIVSTDPLESDARCELTFERDYGEEVSDPLVIEGDGQFRFEFPSVSLGAATNIRPIIDFSTASASYPCLVRRIDVYGHYEEH